MAGKNRAPQRYSPSDQIASLAHSRRERRSNLGLRGDRFSPRPAPSRPGHGLTNLVPTLRELRRVKAPIPEPNFGLCLKMRNSGLDFAPDPQQVLGVTEVPSVQQTIFLSG